MPRLFSALKLPEDVTRYLKELRTNLYGARWVEPSDYHMTLCFFGDLAQDKAYDLCEALDTPGSGIPLAVTLKELAVFGGTSPHSLVILADVTPLLNSLHKKHELAARSVEIPIEKRKYQPHVTLARLKNVSSQEAAYTLSELGFFRPLSFEVEHWGLFSSRSFKGGGPYVEEECFSI